MYKCKIDLVYVYLDILLVLSAKHALEHRARAPVLGHAPGHAGDHGFWRLWGGPTATHMHARRTVLKAHKQWLVGKAWMSL